MTSGKCSECVPGAALDVARTSVVIFRLSSLALTRHLYSAVCRRATALQDASPINAADRKDEMHHLGKSAVPGLHVGCRQHQWHSIRSVASLQADQPLQSNSLLFNVRHTEPEDLLRSKSLSSWLKNASGSKWTMSGARLIGPLESCSPHLTRESAPAPRQWATRGQAQ